MKLGVVVCDLSDIGKTGKSNSFIRLWLRQVESLLCQLRKAILSNFLTFILKALFIILHPSYSKETS
jgi:hypothetical protein